jgi:hypothetical protein
MLICFAIGIGIVKEEETNHIVESKGVEIKKIKRERERKERKLFASCHEELYYKRYQEG